MRFLKLHLEADSELKARCAMSPVTLALDVDARMQFILCLGTTGKIKGIKEASFFSLQSDCALQPAAPWDRQRGCSY